MVLPAETVTPETGLVVPPESPNAIAGAITRFFAEDLGPNLRRGVARVQQEHSWEALAAATIDLADELAPGRGWRDAGAIATHADAPSRSAS